MRTLVLGGARSGKSAYAQSIALATGLAVTYIATAEAGDDEMRERIAIHRKQRDAFWESIEEPVALADALRRHAHPGRCVIVDCLTLWLSNLLERAPSSLNAQFDALRNAVAQARAHVVLVGNETGLGIVPLGALTRRFVDEAGRLHQTLARECERVVFMVAGLPMMLKGNAA